MEPLTLATTDRAPADRVVDQLLHRGRPSIDDGQRLHLTGTGESARLRLREPVTGLRAVVHEGIGDEEYVIALKVLRRVAATAGAATP
ncbi:hypothetical protein ACFXA3_40640 [Streptomyces sp. NPDC059456]|uniref:hypothetical protein n=1 Tax=Streptomyces sp. NPDC059456 TaxID=3346838 RepID=UPI00369B9A6D